MNLFFTFFSGKEYEDLARECVRSFHRFGLDVRMLDMPARGKWMKNCLSRAIILNDIAMDYPDCGIGLLDADLTCNQTPSKLLNFKSDVGVHDLTDIGRLPDDYCHRYSAGVTIFGGTSMGRACLGSWADLCRRDPEEASGVELREQRYLYKAIEFVRGNGAKIENLGKNYNYAVESDVVILHHVASRRLRELSGGGI